MMPPSYSWQAGILAVATRPHLTALDLGRCMAHMQLQPGF